MYTPFQKAPTPVFLKRMALPSVLIGFFFVLCVGIIANSSDFQPSTGPAVVVPFWEAAARIYQSIFSIYDQVPQFCIWGGEVNEFQKHQCGELWDRFSKVGGLALSPLGLTLLFLFLGLNQVTDTYKKAHKKILKGKATFAGVVTNPALGPKDLFSWFFCVRPITVQLPDRKQMTVWISLDEVIPTPGQTLALFEVGTVLGQKRHFAISYNPHVAIVRGA